MNIKSENPNWNPEDLIDDANMKKEVKMMAENPVFFDLTEEFYQFITDYYQKHLMGTLSNGNPDSFQLPEGISLALQNFDPQTDTLGKFDRYLTEHTPDSLASNDFVINNANLRTIAIYCALVRYYKEITNEDKLPGEALVESEKPMDRYSPEDKRAELLGVIRQFGRDFLSMKSEEVRDKVTGVKNPIPTPN